MHALSSVQGMGVQLLGKQHNVAQLLLFPLQSVSVEAQAIVYSSKVAIDADPTWKGLQGNYQHSCYRQLLVNKGDSLEYVAVGVPEGGPILVLNPQLVNDLMVRTSLLLATAKVSSQPCPSFSAGFRAVKGDGVVLLQAQGPILEKTLAEGEEVDVPITRIAAFSTNVTVSIAERNNVLGKVDEMRTLKGPGVVFMASIDSGPRSKPTFSALDILLFLILMYFPCSLCSLGLAYIKRLLSIYES